MAADSRNANSFFILPPISGAPDGDFSWSTAEQAYLDAHPGLEEQLRANAYDFFAREVAGSMSPPSLPPPRGKVARRSRDG